MIVETYQFICKHCDKGYRGLVKTCPNCGAILRDKQREKEIEENNKRTVWKLSVDYPKGEERFDDTEFNVRD